MCEEIKQIFIIYMKNINQEKQIHACLLPQHSMEWGADTCRCLLGMYRVFTGNCGKVMGNNTAV